MSHHPPQPAVDRLTPFAGHPLVVGVEECPDGSVLHGPLSPDAAAIMVGGRAPGAGVRLMEAVTGSVSMHLAHHQHRPVLTVPISVVDWHDTPSAWDRR